MMPKPLAFGSLPIQWLASILVTVHNPRIVAHSVTVRHCSQFQTFPLIGVSKMPTITVKLYRCTTCGSEFETSTNHEGEIYGSCKKCSSYGNQSISVCETESAKDARRERDSIRVKVYPYRYDIDDPAQNAAYKAMRDCLRENGFKLFSHITASTKDHCSIAAIVRHMQSGAINMEVFTDWSGGQQWAIAYPGGRLHAWEEAAYPNKAIKFGYHIAIEDFDRLPKKAK